MSDPILDQLFIDHFNADLAVLNCMAHVDLFDLGPDDVVSRQALILMADAGSFVTELPLSAAPDMTALAYALYGKGLIQGSWAGKMPHGQSCGT